MGDKKEKKEPSIDHKVLDKTILKVLAYKPKRKPRAAPNPGSAARK